MFAGVLQHNYKGFIMATTDLLHKNLTDPQLHEPKGLSTAEENTVYVADGYGSGAWKPVAFDLLDFEKTSVQSSELLEIPEVTELNSADIALITNGVLDYTRSFDTSNKNFKELAEECEQLRNSLAVAHANITALNQTVEAMRTALVTLGVLADG